jgi:predicted lipoprotein with Yx(FWY)xxD motif
MALMRQIERRIVMKNKLFLPALIVIALIASACASATPTATAAPVMPVVSTDTPAAMPVSTDTGAAPAATTAPAASGGTVVNVGQTSALGSFLVDSKGMTLYLYTKDTPNTSNCSGGCASAWPPLLTTGAPTAGTGVTASLLGTTTRADGTTQVTYNGWPLYYYASDAAAGDTTGEGVGSVWYVITPAGVQK